MVVPLLSVRVDHVDRINDQFAPVASHGDTLIVARLAARIVLMHDVRVMMERPLTELAYKAVDVPATLIRVSG